MKISKTKLLLAVIISLMGFYFAAPNFLNHKLFSTNKVSLGLDLQGGAHLLYEVDVENYFNEYLEKERNCL